MPKVVCSRCSKIAWSTVSKAADKSRRIRAAVSPRSTACSMFDSTRRTAVSVECPWRNPDCKDGYCPSLLSVCITPKIATVFPEDCVEGRMKNRDFRPISRLISETIQNTSFMFAHSVEICSWQHCKKRGHKCRRWVVVYVKCYRETRQRRVKEALPIGRCMPTLTQR